ncbi:MAG TPA: NAD(P)-binding domain-containing protein, partial [Candidatus Binatia bacterium]|nr:NAD(P)-binding domain-containing protein [Candidatus Binatia bacterium]
MERIGFVGLGRMGRPMAARLVEAGFPLAVYDVRDDARAAFEGRAAPSLAALARASDVVITMLPDGDAVRRAVGGDGDRL